MKPFITAEPSKTKSALILLFWLLIWQIVYLAVAKDVIIPSPANTFSALGQLLLTQAFYRDVAATMGRVLAGIVISFGAGLLTAIGAYLIFLVRDIMGFMINILKSTPVMAVIIFALLWLPSGNVPIFVCFLMCYPIVYTNVLTGLDSLSRDYIEMSRIYRIRRRDLIESIYLPFVAPHIKSALSLTTGLSWKTVVAAEVLSSPAFSMGYNLLNAKVYLDTESLFAWIIAIVALSMAFEKIVNLLLGIRRGGPVK
jgi:NitT/TauT family transport system permease protein